MSNPRQSIHLYMNAASDAGRIKRVIEVLRTNDIVLISRVESLLDERGIGFFVADQFTSAIKGSLGILPRRVLVPLADAAAARRVLSDAGLEHELAPVEPLWP